MRCRLHEVWMYYETSGAARRRSNKVPWRDDCAVKRVCYHGDQAPARQIPRFLMQVTSRSYIDITNYNP